jgi:hypothetical protein
MMCGDRKRQEQSGGPLVHRRGRSEADMIDVDLPPAQLVLEKR